MIEKTGAKRTKQHKESKHYFKYDLLVAGILYLLCIILFFYPSLKYINTSLIGPPEDNMYFFWNMWWANKAFTEPQASLTFTHYIFYPQGKSLIYQDYSFYNLFLSLLLKKFVNLITTYNLLIFQTFFLAGIGAFLLIKYLTKNSYISLIGGFIFAFNPSHFAHSLHHINIASIQFVPFFVLFFIKAIKGDSKKDLILACLFFFLNAICTWYNMVFAVYFIVFSYLYLMFRRKKFFLPRVLIKSSIVLGTTLLFLLPWLLKMVLLGFKFHKSIDAGHNVFVADTFALFVPHPYHWLAHLEIVKNINLRFTGNPWELTVYLGIINILIIFFCFKGIIRKTAKYFYGLLAFLILSMGESVHVLGQGTPIILPYKIIKYIPFFSNARCPSRAIVFVYLFLAIIIGYSLKYLISLNKSRRKRICLIAILILFIVADFNSLCHSLSKVYLPPCYDVIQKEDEDFGILDLPGGHEESAKYMMFQTKHGFPIVQGISQRRLVISLLDYIELENVKRQKKQLIENKVKYVVIHKKFFFEKMPNGIFQEDWNEIQNNQLKRFEQFYRLIYEDEENVVFQVHGDVPP